MTQEEHYAAGSTTVDLKAFGLTGLLVKFRFKPYSVACKLRLRGFPRHKNVNTTGTREAERKAMFGGGRLYSHS